ncbi:carbon-nitrogen hydrolase family protein [Spirosoma sp. KNUC1025]|uniref:carbon-nitrogen hydrolase family protein n=1 Tax=Spirosoma sp. KNUC1025 TaxID=2894082 RepID=UPI00386BFAE1|nr:carbon-nitrogen hydrolase family protein [Spirosoma sp. KNUC1025]
MKISVAQTRPGKGAIQQNIEQHKKLIDLAVTYGVDTIIFPELSLTGYEPTLAKELATDYTDDRFDDFQLISDRNQITIGVGMPTTTEAGIRISMLIFQPEKPRQLYSKQHLHADEYPYFVGGQEPVLLAAGAIALAICYELSVPEHAGQAFQSGATVYMASVAKTASGVEKAVDRLAEIARTYSMTVLMANCVGYCDNVVCGGKSSIWNSKGELVGQLTDMDMGILILDTDTSDVFTAISD